MLASVTDPRSPQGIQHALVFVLAVCVVAMLAGAKNYREIAGHAADMPQSLLRKLGAEWSNLTLGLLRMKNVNAIKETTEWVCRDQVRALQFMTT